MRKIKPIKQVAGVDCHGRTVSPFSVTAVEIVETGRWTWECVEYNGNVTVGLCRQAVDTYAEALDVAEKAAAVTGAEVVR